MAAFLGTPFYSGVSILALMLDLVLRLIIISIKTKTETPM